MKQPNTAQLIYMQMGVDLSRLMLYGRKNPSATKKGSGRYHKQDYKKG